MNLLLTSAGITNPTIAKTILELVGKPAQDISVLFIPTATNIMEGDKSWLIDNLNDFKRQGYACIDILDIAGVPESVWKPRMEAADLITFGGGNEQYLAKVMGDTGVERALPELLKNRVYMGISAGSMVAGQFLPPELLSVIYPEEVFEEFSEPLAFVNCLFLPHLNSEYFSHATKEVLEKHRADFAFPLYACDDNSALKIVDGKFEIVGEGESVVITMTQKPK